MPEKYHSRYRVSSARASWWDYGNNASYYLTLCTRNRLHFFGEIIDGTMYKSAIGEIAEMHWRDIPIRFRYIQPDEFVIMPNHIHGILHIDKAMDNNFKIGGSDSVNSNDMHSSDDFVETRFIASLQNHQRGGITGIHNPMLHQNLSRVMRWFTGRVSYESHKVNADFNWQRRFHDHIIRDVIEYRLITRYIHSNPLNWEKDQFY